MFNVSNVKELCRGKGKVFSPIFLSLFQPPCKAPQDQERLSSNKTATPMITTLYGRKLGDLNEIQG